MGCGVLSLRTSIGLAPLPPLETSPAAIFLGTVVLALAANTYELLCTAGFPLVFTRILTLSNLRPLKYYLHLTLYNVVYILPLAAVVAVFSFTLGSRKLSEAQGRVMKLVSGLMMLGLGAVVLVDPGLFNNVIVGVGLLAFALLAAAAIVGLERWREAAGGMNRSHPLPLGTFIDIYTDQTVTSALKEIGLKEGTWYEGTITVKALALKVCETRFALFKEFEILEVLKPGK